MPEPTRQRVITSAILAGFGPPGAPATSAVSPNTERADVRRKPDERPGRAIMRVAERVDGAAAATCARPVSDRVSRHRPNSATSLPHIDDFFVVPMAMGRWHFVRQPARSARTFPPGTTHRSVHQIADFKLPDLQLPVVLAVTCAASSFLKYRAIIPLGGSEQHLGVGLILGAFASWATRRYVGAGRPRFRR